jgi:CheY-like chemotaxis protein
VRTVLIVEDDADLRDAIADALAFGGHKTIPASNGRDALAILHRTPGIDLIVLDLMMPVMNGWEFRERQLLDPEIASIPVVILSALPGTVVNPVKEALRFTKPVKMQSLLDAVDKFDRTL